MSEFVIETKSYKRKDTHYITINIENTLEEDVLSEDGHEINVRPRWVKADGSIIHDPEFGRCERVEKIQAGKSLVLKTKVSEDELPGDAKEYELAYGIVQEFKKWYEDFGYITIEVKRD